MRERGPLFLNLFTMMLSCGIPELRTRDDISYIRSITHSSTVGIMETSELKLLIQTLET